MGTIKLFTTYLQIFSVRLTDQHFAGFVCDDNLGLGVRYLAQSLEPFDFPIGTDIDPQMQLAY